MEVSGPASVYSPLEVAAVEQALRTLEGGILNLKGWQGPGDEVSKMILGLHNWLRGTVGDAASRAEAMRIVGRTMTVIGIPNQPKGRELALVVAGLCGGIVFDGVAVFDSAGTVLASAVE